MADTPKHSVSVAGIVVDDQDRVLVIQRRDNGHWEPPGGVLELDESIEDGVKREILEETGVRVQVGALSGVYKNMEKGVVALVFRCAPEEGRLQESDESAAVRWMSTDEVAHRMVDAYAIRVRDALSANALAVKVRAHDGKSVI